MFRQFQNISPRIVPIKHPAREGRYKRRPCLRTRHGLYVREDECEVARDALRLELQGSEDALVGCCYLYEDAGAGDAELKEQR